MTHATPDAQFLRQLNKQKKKMRGFCGVRDMLVLAALRKDIFKLA